MSATTELFTRWKDAKGHETDSAAAVALGLTKQVVWNWFSRDLNGPVEVVERMAIDLGEDPAVWILQAFKDAEKNAAARKALDRIAKRLGKAGCIVAAFIVSAPADAAPLVAGGFSHSYTALAITACVVFGLDIMRSIRSIRGDPGRASIVQHRDVPAPSFRRGL